MHPRSLPLLFLVLLFVTACRGEPPTGPSTQAQSAAGGSRAEPEAPAEEVRAPRELPPGATVRRPALVDAGWYPGDADALRESVQGFIDAAAAEHDAASEASAPMALIAPHAGYRWSGATAGHAYQTLMGHRFRRVFVLAPAHRVPLRGAAVPSVDAFATPLGPIPIATEVVRALAESPHVAVDDAPHAEEHAVEIQLPFLQVALPEGFELVPIVIGDVDLDGVRALASVLAEHVGPDDLVVASSDFTHYGQRFGYTPFHEKVAWNLKKLDLGAYQQIEALSADGFWRYRRDTGITVCGFVPIAVTLAMLPPEARAELLAYDTSGRITGDFESSVSYLSVALRGPGWAAERGSAAPLAIPDRGVELTGGPAVLDTSEQRATLRLARGVVETFVRTGRVPSPVELGVGVSPTMRRSLGVFVTLKKGGMLRGCIGNIWPVAPLVEGIVGRAVDAAAHDGRFPPVRPDELADLEVELSVLTPPSPVSSADAIVLGRHGIVLEKAGRRSVFLPQVAPEQGWNLEETLTQLSLKAGLPADGWRRGARFLVFEAQVFHEAE